MTDLKWTKKTTRKISEELTSNGIKVGPNTVAKLMKELRYSLKTNQKTIEAGKRKPGHVKKRNKQFKKIKSDRKKFSKKGFPIISVDSKKKENIGNFKNSGRTWCKESKKVNDHDFKSYAIGTGVPYGIYDTEKNSGMVVMGTSYETPAFAVDSIATWWNMVGKKTYPNANEIMILSDCGGGNSCRSRVWKRDLQEKICNKFGIAVTVRHYPPGASKWNPIEHRYFSEISKNWAGVPLQSYEIALKYIRTTKTKTGLQSRAVLRTKEYKKGQKVSDQDMSKIKISFHKERPEWNYTIRPQ
jgi:hypothetical protein